MEKTRVLTFFGGRAATAEKFGITVSAIDQWGEIIPEGRAYQAQTLSDGALVVDPAVYTTRGRGAWRQAASV